MLIRFPTAKYRNGFGIGIGICEYKQATTVAELCESCEKCRLAEPFSLMAYSRFTGMGLGNGTENGTRTGTENGTWTGTENGTKSNLS